MCSHAGSRDNSWAPLFSPYIQLFSVLIRWNKVTTEVFSTDILEKEHFWQEILKVNEDFLFGCSSSVFWGRGKYHNFSICFLF